MDILGIDIGGSGIKGAVVDSSTGELRSERLRLSTPKGGKKADTLDVLRELVRAFAWKGSIGLGFPGVIQQGVIRTAANLGNDWIGTHLPSLCKQVTNCPGVGLNDADAAGLAEVVFGAGRGKSGVLAMITVGTGLGTALFFDGHLMPNSELGHLWLRKVNQEAEDWCSDRTREKEDLGWKAWGDRFNGFLRELHALIWADCYIIGGGASKKFEKFAPCLDKQLTVLPATLRNQAGIIGAALHALRSGL